MVDDLFKRQVGENQLGGDTLALGRARLGRQAGRLTFLRWPWQKPRAGRRSEIARFGSRSTDSRIPLLVRRSSDLTRSVGNARSLQPFIVTNPNLVGYSIRQLKRPDQGNEDDRSDPHQEVQGDADPHEVSEAIASRTEDHHVGLVADG